MIHEIDKPGSVLGLFMTLVAVLFGMVTTSGFAEETEQLVSEGQSSGFKYSDDWSIVSAPPPPGPYYSVNVDPRVPGQEDNLPPSATGYESPGQDEMINTFMSAPPSAGIPANQTAQGGRPSPYQTPPYGNSYRPYATPYPYGYQPYRMTPPNYSYPNIYGPQGSRYPSQWPPVQVPETASGSEDEVPPPPVYDRMTRTTPPGPYGYRRGGY